MDDEWRRLNRANWDERVAVHLAPGGYDLAPLHAGARRLDSIVEAELPPVAGLHVLHLQCHFGLDTLTLAQRGAVVTGLDFSGAAITGADRLAAELGLLARFVQADLYDAPAALPEPGSFDLVFITWGTICWLPDIMGWGRIIASFLKPGGALYFADAHPASYVFDNEGMGGAEDRPGWFTPYFGRQPVAYEDATDYANATAPLSNIRQVNWLHPLADILGALRSAGLQLDWLHEHARIPWRMFQTLERGPDELWTWPGRPWLPLSMSLRAVKRAV